MLRTEGTYDIHYVYKDHLGSWTTITDYDGVVQQELSFDAWGNLRDPETWSGEFTGTPMLDRGFTGHEHLYNFGLINMNERMYDPVMSSFLSPDNYVQAPDFSQSFNRYAYCLNNPLKYTDPSGEIPVLAVVAIGAAVNVIMNGINNVRHGENFFHGAGPAAVTGGVQGLFTYGIGESANAIGTAIKNQATAHLAKAGFQLVAHGTMGGMSTMSRGGKFWHGFVSSATASVMSTAINQTCIHFQLSEGLTKTAMIAGGALSGGISAKMAGGDFIDGFCNGLICAGLNHALHWVVEGGGKPFVRWLKDHANKYKHHYQTDIVNPEGRCKAAMAANIGNYFGSKNGGENYYWGRFKSLYEVDRNVSLEEYFSDCGFDFEIVGNNEIVKSVDLLPEGKLIVFEMKTSRKFSSHVVALTGAVRESNDSDAMFRISNPMNRTENWEPYNKDFHNTIKRIFIIRGLK